MKNYEVELTILKQEHIPLLKDMVKNWIKQESVVYPYGIVKAYRSAIHDIIYNGSEQDDEAESTVLMFLLDKQLNEFIGAVDIRRYSSRVNSKGYINSTIAYGISPLYRRKGYGTKQLELAINICNELGIKEINMLCNKNNIGSRKIIEANSGLFVRQIQVGDKTLLEYIIKQYEKEGQ